MRLNFQMFVNMLCSIFVVSRYKIVELSIVRFISHCVMNLKNTSFGSFKYSLEALLTDTLATT